MADIQYREAQLEDEAFVNSLTRTTMRKYVEAMWASEKEREHYYEINTFCQYGTRIIQYDGVDIGRITTTQEEDKIFLDELHILPEYQGNGIGKQVLQCLLEDAAFENLTVELSVLRSNPAKRLYERLGFEIYKEDEARYYLSKNPRVQKNVKNF